MSSASISALTIARLRGEELSNISHALRTPLTSIVGFADAILNDPALAKDQEEEFVRIIKSEGEKLSKFVDELMYASISAKEMTPAESWDVVAIITSAFHNVSVPAASRSLTLRHNVPSDLPRLLLAKEFAIRMLDNVLTNAIRYASQSSEIVVDADVFGSNLLLSVHSDRQLSVTIGEVPHLGLARTMYLVSLHGGSLLYEKSPDNKAIVTLRLPIGN